MQEAALQRFSARPALVRCCGTTLRFMSRSFSKLPSTSVPDHALWRTLTAGLLPDSLLDGCETRIWLQLKPGCDVKGLIDQLHVLDPFMLLNLRKLRYGV
eukprot:GHUV01039694.1.p2 GENE.GHUV01039694.1~~GHUV01039694.1.p2  ORF type:complete len:100 (-),score=16.80 GHUV01039694.1:464-763(-)